MRTEKRIAAFCMFMLVGGIALPVVNGQPAPDRRREPGLQKLLDQRRDHLKAAADLRVRQFESGGCDLRDVLMAKSDLLDAALDAAQTRAERIAILEKLLATMKTSVATAEQMHQIGRITEIGLHRAKAEQLRVEIRLRREGTGAAPPTQD